MNFVDLHETNISQKVEIIVEHFWNNVMCQLDGKAKAMVITSSRKGAVEYRNKFIEYVSEKKYPIHSLVAFSGQVKLDDDTVVSESSLNGISEDKLPDTFDGDGYHVLLVADKYQTGFDQPKLCAMYVDKPLKGVNAVQTLSRLNRICLPYDKKTFILDFKNDVKGITDAFSTYYSGTELLNSVQPSDIYRLMNEMEEYGVLNINEIKEFNEELRRPNGDKVTLWKLIGAARGRYIKLTGNQQYEFRSIVKRYIRLYCFLIQATCYEDVESHMVYSYLSYLIKELEVTGGTGPLNISDKITASNFYQKKTGEVKVDPEPKPGVRIAPPGTSNFEEDEMKKLSQIIAEINARYNMNFDKDTTLSSLMQIRDILLKDEKLKTSAKNNTKDMFKYAFDRSVDNALYVGYDHNIEFYKLLLDNKDVRNDLLGVMMSGIYHKLKTEKETNVT